MKTKTKRRICIVLGALAFMLMLGVVGGMERDLMPMGRGTVLALVYEAVGAFCFWKAGVIRL